MCCPGDLFACADTDKFLGHGTIAKAFAKYITFTPTLRCRSPSDPSASTHAPEPLDMYIARVVHESQVPEEVPYVAIYLLVAISQSCHCKVLHDTHGVDDRHHSPSRLSHTFSRALTRSPFSRISKPHWSGKHIFMGAFYVALLAYRSTLPEEQAKEMHCWNILTDVSGISDEELGDISTAFKKCVTGELQMTIENMLCGNDMRSVADVECHFAIARRKQLTKAAKDGKEKGSKRRRSLKRSVSTFWKSPEKVTLVAMEREAELPPDSGSLEFRCYSPPPNSSYVPA